MHNPYNYRMAVRDDAMFFGREKLVTRLLEDVGLRTSAFVLGGRRCGKTSLLSKLMRELHLGGQDPRGPRVIPCNLDLQRGRTPAGVDDFFLWVLEELGDTWERQENLVRGQAVEVLLAEYRHVGVRDALRAFERAVQALDVGDKDIRLVFLIDEAERLFLADWAAELASRLRYLLSGNIGGLEVVAVMASSREVDSVSVGYGSPLMNIFARYLLQTLPQEATLALALEPNDGSLPEEVAFEVWRQSGGHPCQAQYLLYRLWEDLEGNLGRATVVDVQTAAVEFEARTGLLSHWADNLGQVGLDLYRFLAEQYDEVTLQEIRQHVPEKGVGLLSGPLNALLYHGLIREEGRGYKKRFRIAGQIFRDWFLSTWEESPTADLDVAAVRELLVAAFTPTDLGRFCRDRPAFRPLLDRFGPGHGVDDMVDEVIEYCDKQLLFDELLAAVQEANPRQYARFGARFASGAPSPIAPVRETPRPGELPANFLVPYPRNPEFVGRDAELEILARALTAPAGAAEIVAPQAIQGMGGLGKSQLAAEFAYLYGHLFEGVFWLSAVQPELLDEQIAASGLAMALSPWPEELPEQVRRTLAAWWDGGPYLVILDGLDDVEAAQKWLPRLGEGDVRLLLITRRAEWPADLGVELVRLGALSVQESRILLRAYVAEDQATDADLDALSERLGHLPVALALAGAYLEHRPELSASAYLEQLDEVLSHPSMQVWREELTVPEGRDPSLTTALALTWGQVEDVGVRRLFTLAGHCAPNQPIPFDLLVRASELDEEACNEGLLLLADLGLMDWEAGEIGPRIHLLLTEYVRSLTAAEGESEILATLASALAELASEANESGLPVRFLPLQPHVEIVAAAAQEAELEQAGVLWNELGTYLLLVADYGAARVAFGRALAVDEAALGLEHPRVARDLNNLGGVLHAMGAYSEARDVFQRALAINEQLLGSEHPEVARAANNLGRVLEALGEYQAAREAYLRALAIDKAGYGPDDPRVAAGMSNLGKVLYDLGDYQSAREAYQQALAINEAAYGADHPGVAQVLNNLSQVLHELGDAKGARLAVQRALAIDEDAFGPDHPNVAYGLANLGRLLVDLNEFGEAREAFQRALAIDETAFGLEHPYLARDLEGLGWALHWLGDDAGARAAYERALAINEAAFGEMHHNTATTLNDLGWLLMEMGEYDEARAALERALGIYEAVLGPDHPRVADPIGNLGILLRRLDDYEGARDAFQRALAITRRVYGPDHRRLAQTLNHLGGVLYGLGRLVEAREALEGALNISEKLDDEGLLIRILNNLGDVDRAIGQIQQAVVHYRGALSLAREAGDDQMACRILAGLGMAYRDLDSLETAETMLSQASGLPESLDDRALLASQLGSMALVLQKQGALTRALDQHEEALRLARESGEGRIEARQLDNLGTLYVELGKPDSALDYLQQALAKARELGDRRREGLCLRHLGNLYASLGEEEQALTYYQAAFDVLQEVGDRRGEAGCLTDLGDIYRHRGEEERAIAVYESALAALRAISDDAGERAGLRNLAQMHEALGQAGQALGYYEQLADHYRRTEKRLELAEALIAMGHLARDAEQFEQAKAYWLESLNICREQGHPLESAVESLMRELEIAHLALFSLDEIAKSFLQSAGFELLPSDVEQIFMCRPIHPAWEADLPYPVPLAIVSGSALDADMVWALCRAATRASGQRPPVLFVVIDRTPDDSGWLQIATLRSRNVQVIPIDDTVISAGQERDRQRWILQKHLRRFLGRERDLYNVRDPVADRLNFFGREALASELLDMLGEGRPVALFGLRKMGKSSLLLYVRDQLAFPTALVDLQTGVELGQLYQRIFVSWMRSMRVKLPGVDWSPPDLSQGSDTSEGGGLSGSADLSSGFAAATRDLLSTLEEHGAPTRLCLLVDEADLIVPEGERGLDRYLAFARTLRGLVQEEEGRFLLLLAGVDPFFNRVNRLEGQQNPFYQFFLEVYLPALESVDCSQMIRNIGRQMGLVYGDKAVEFVTRVSGGHPFIARQLCSLAFRHWDRQGEIPLDHLQEMALRFIRAPGTSELLDEHGLWGEISDPRLWPQPQVVENQAVLKSLAETEPQPEVALVDRAQDSRACERSLDELTRRAVLGRPELSVYDIRLRLFRSWIQRYELGQEASL